MGRGEALFGKELREAASKALENPSARRIFGLVLSENFYGEPTLALGQGGYETTAYREGRRAAALELANVLTMGALDSPGMCLREYEEIKRLFDEHDEEEDVWR